MASILAPLLPPELTDMVIDYLADDKAALATTSLVARTWLVRSRVHLFRRVSVTADFVAFAAFLRESPCLHPYIRHLVLQGRDAFNIANFPCPSSSSCSSSRVPSLAPLGIVTLEPIVLGAILIQLPCLQSLQMHEVSFRGRAWPYRSPELKISDVVMMNVGSIEDTTNDFLHVLGLFSDVEYLYIQSVAQKLDLDDRRLCVGHLDIPKSLRLHALKLEDVPAALYLQVIRHTDSLRSLKAMDVECAGLEDAMLLSELLGELESDVECLCLNLLHCFTQDEPVDEDSDSDEEPDEPPIPNSRAIRETLCAGVSSCPHLTTLDISISLDTPPTSTPPTSSSFNGWDSLAGILHSAPSTLRRIDICLAADMDSDPDIDIDMDADREGQPLKMQALPWHPIAAALQRFARVERVAFVNVPGSVWGFEEAEKEVVRRNLRELAESGLLQVGWA
ncbi:hypothetical protein BDW22DRAFT_1344830 [Trametopsis cervina]|nr:hypothetical protein BDW22DRAFT_1344830 [Trametopsis cervina]